MKRKEKNQFSENVTSLQQKKKKKKKKVKISLDRIIINQLHYMLTFTNNKNINIRVFFFIFFSKWILLSLTLKVISYTNCYFATSSKYVILQNFICILPYCLLRTSLQSLHQIIYNIIINVSINIQYCYLIYKCLS